MKESIDSEDEYCNLDSTVVENDNSASRKSTSIRAERVNLKYVELG